MTFAKNNNVGEIAARTSAQQVVADNIGLGLSVAIMWSCRHMPVMQRAIPFFMYPLLAFIDLGGIHKYALSTCPGAAKDSMIMVAFSLIITNRFACLCVNVDIE